MEESIRIGPYQHITFLDRGRSAEVHLAKHGESGELVAIKVLHEFISNRQEKTQEKFLKEVKIVRDLDHPGIVKIIDTGFVDTELRQGKRPYIVMPYASGGTLRQKLEAHGGLLPSETIRSYTRQLADALNYAHQHDIIHCDVKPENVLLDKDGHLLLGDFGIARIRAETLSGVSMTTQEPFGTLVYMAPEQFKGKPHRAIDQYALATMIYEWFCGHPPFDGTTYERLINQHVNARVPSLQKACKASNSKVSKKVEQVLLKALNKKHRDRYSSIQDFAQALDQALEEMILQEQRLALLSTATTMPILETEEKSLTASSALPPSIASNPDLLVQSPTVNDDSATLEIASSSPLPDSTGSQKVGGAKKGVLERQVLIAVAILVIIASVVGVGTQQIVVRQMNASATATAQANYPSYLSGSGTLVFADPLSQERGSKWSSSTNSTAGVCQFTGRAYRVSLKATHSSYYCPAGGTFSDFTFEVQLTITRGDCGGVFFGKDDSVEVCQDGTYALGTSWAVFGGGSSTIHTDLGRQNKIAVVVNGSTITLYINEHKINQEQDSSYTSGTVGLTAASDIENATDVIYTNAKLWTP